MSRSFTIFSRSFAWKFHLPAKAIFRMPIVHKT